MKRGPATREKSQSLLRVEGLHSATIIFFRVAYVGISKMVSMGNKIDLDEIDYLRYLIRDSRTEIIGLYLESIQEVES